MISGKEALIALANGEEVELMFNYKDEWHLVNKNDAYAFSIFLDERGTKFRLKPQAITNESFEFKGSVSMEKHSDNISIRFSNKDDCARWHNALRQVFK